MATKGASKRPARRGFQAGVIERHLLGRLVSYFMMTTLALGVLVSGRLFATLLDRISGYSFPADALFELWLYGSLKPVSLLVPFTVLLAVLLTFGSLYRDGEAYAMFGMGVSYRRVYSVLTRFVLPIALFLLVFELFLRPVAERNYAELKDDSRRRMDGAIVAEGRFLHPREGLAVFVERIDGDGLHGIFSAEHENGVFTVEVAESGVQRREDGRHLLSLSDGHRYLGVAGGDHYHRLRYTEHKVAIAEPVSEQARRMSVSSAGVHELLAAGPTEAYAELQWRVSVPLAAVLLALIAFPLSFTPPRSNHQVRIVFGLLVFLAYYGGLIVLHRAMLHGGWPLIPGAFAAHGAVLAAWPLIFYRARIARGLRRSLFDAHG